MALPILKYIYISVCVFVCVCVSFMGKDQIHYKRLEKERTKVYTVYTKTPKGHTKQREIQKRIASPYLEPNQSMKSTMDIE